VHPLSLCTHSAYAARALTHHIHPPAATACTVTQLMNPPSCMWAHCRHHLAYAPTQPPSSLMFATSHFTAWYCNINERQFPLTTWHIAAMLHCRYWEKSCRRRVRHQESLIQQLDQVMARFKGDEGLDPETLLYAVTGETEELHCRIIQLIKDNKILGKYMHQQVPKHLCGP
jgi:hypothetical protein